MDTGGGAVERSSAGPCGTSIEMQAWRTGMCLQPNLYPDWPIGGDLSVSSLRMKTSHSPPFLWKQLTPDFNQAVWGRLMGFGRICVPAKLIFIKRKW